MASFVLVELGSRRCALPLSDVIETMRPLPIERVPGVPPYVLGLSIIRGAPVPIVDLGKLLGVAAHGRGRFVTLRAGERRVAVEVDHVIGVRPFAPAALEQLPPLLGDAALDAVEALGTLDAQLLLVLRASRLVPEETWQELGMT